MVERARLEGVWTSQGVSRVRISASPFFVPKTEEPLPVREEFFCFLLGNKKRTPERSLFGVQPKLISYPKGRNFFCFYSEETEILMKLRLHQNL